MEQQKSQVSEQEMEKIEFRSEEVREILGAIPHWTVRVGATYLFGLILVVLAISWFVRYPDMIKAPAVITTEVPPANIISQSAGYITLWVKDKQKIAAGQYLGFLKSNADTREVLALRTEIDSFKVRFYRNPMSAKEYPITDIRSLGELQDAYNNFIRNVRSFQFTVQQNAASIRAGALRKEIKEYNTLTGQQREQAGIMHNELQLARQLFERDSLLFLENVISKSEYEQKKREYLSSSRSYKSSVSGITNTEIQKDQLSSRVTQITLEDQVQVKDMLLAIEAAVNELDKRIREWEHSFMIKSPIGGNVALFNYWANDQYIKAGEELLSVIPENENFVARARVPVAGAGKLAKGQKVNLKLDNYPYQEYGMIKGTISSISLLPKENSYSLIIQLERELDKKYEKKIEFRQELSGQAEIITEDMRLIERVFYQFKKLID